MTAPIPPLTYTLDLEEHRSHGGGRYVANSERLLDFFAEHRIRATVFVVGNVAQAAPALMRRIHAEGHELALHSATHTPLTEENPTRWRSEVDTCKRWLEDLTGVAVTGFRAPIFSLTPRSSWALDELATLGFTYSSSVLPGRHPLFGFPGVPRTPFRWSCGLYELPPPLLELGGAALPFLGGIYLRYLPLWLITRCARACTPQQAPWSYVHPYDVDTAEGYYRFPGTQPWMSLLLWRRRGGTFARLSALFAASGNMSAPPLGELVKGGMFAHVPLVAGGGNAG